ncbi:MAG TPA: hypothetical protein VLI91_07665 [Roseiarcus sp.]|nr:hypothetical protein [Roseiarcus sp.]
MGGFRVGAAAAVVALALPGSAGAAQLKIIDVKAYAFLEHAGKLSDDLVSGGQSLVDTPRGGALGGDTATGLLIDFTFEGDKNASPKYATAVIDLTQISRSGQPVTTHRAFTNFIFGPDGIEHKAVFLEAATCMPLAIQVHAGKTERTAKLDFHCTETAAPK